MVTVLFTILKIIGIVLLCILLLLLFLILSVLFVPVRYSVCGQYEGAPDFHLKITWFLHLFSIKAEYTDSFHYQIKFFGISFSFFQKLFSKKAKKEKPKKSINPAPQSETISDEKVTGAPIASSVSHLNETKENGKTAYKKQKKKKNPFLCLQNLLLKIKNIFNNIAYYLDILTGDTMKLVLQTGKRRIGQIFKSVLPKRGYISIHFGLDDPSMTANIIGIYSLLFPYTKNTLKLFPDYTHTCFSACFKAKGRIFSFILFYQGLRLFFDKNIRQLLKTFKKENAYE